MRPVFASRPTRRPAALNVAAVGLAFAALFFGDGSSQGRLFWIGAAAVVVAAVGWAFHPVRVSGPGLLFFGALGAFVVWQGLSIAWSIQPSRSWDYTNRGLAYFAFAAVGALVAGVSLRRFAAVAALLLGALFAWALAAKVVPGLYSDYGRLSRLRYPVGYWNELALLAAASVPLGLWAVRRWRVAGALLLYEALVVAVLTYSRVGIVLTIVAAVVWLVLDGERLEAVGPLAVAWIVAALVAGVALLLPGISSDSQPHSVRVQDGLLFGAAFVIGAVAIYLALRFVVTRAVDLRLVRAAAAGFGALVVLALVVSVVRAGGPADFVRDRWHEFNNPASAQVANQPGRIVSASSSNRWRWWQEAWHAFVDHPLKGTGAGTFGLTDRIERRTSLAVTEPHSAAIQDLSETGIVGLLLVGTFVGAALWGIVRRERTGALTALGLGVLICILHSLVDIDWDYVAVQGPLFLTVGALVTGPVAAPSRRSWLGGAAVFVCALAALYSLISPWLADNRVNAGLDALTSGHRAQALTEFKSAHAFNPLAIEPLLYRAAVEPFPKALQLYREARDLEPKNAETWYELGYFELRYLRQPRAAYRDLNQSYTLDRYGPASVKGGALDQARCLVDPATCPGSGQGASP
jgi:O-Antigen ligase